MRRLDDLPAWLWLWLVLLFPVLQFGTWALVPDRSTYTAAFEGEFGAVEILTALLLLPAALLALASARFFWRSEARTEAALLVAFALGCLFLLGEEVSWGQHYFNWSSPEYFEMHNKQGETNLHNMAYFNKKLPKLIVIIGIAIGGLVIPIWAKVTSAWPNPESRRFVRLLPTHICMPAAIIVVVTHVGVKILLKRYDIGSVTDLIGISVREITELYISVFFMLYILSLHRRVVVGNAEPELTGKGLELR